jgi:iron complex outermembrane receptor protein
VALACAAAVLGLSAGAQAQTSAQQAGRAAADGVQVIEVSGIRASIQASITAKRNAATNVEVITAEDVGKLPDKNIADALSRLPGLNVQFGGALAMDEAERIAIRGTSPNLNLTTINGHALASGDWHVGDQGSSGRSVGFGLMPSQLIGRAVVYKTGQADITEGGIAGTVDIQTRKPLDFRKTLTGELAIGAVYADLPKKTDPQLSGMVSFKNDAGTFGALVQAFSEKRHLRRDGQETFGFNVIGAGAALSASGGPTVPGGNVPANPTLYNQLLNKRLPGSLNSALFEGVRERTGGYVGVQFKPTRNLDLNFSAFRVTLDADNYNSSGFALPNALITNGWLVGNATFDGDVMTGATLSRPATASANQRVIGFQFDNNVRQGASSLSSFYDFDFKWNLGEKFVFDGRIGYTEGNGITNSQPSLTFGIVNPNLTYQINTTRPTDYRLTDAVTGQPIAMGSLASYNQMSNTGAKLVSKDDESYVHLNGTWKIDGEVFSNLKFGVRTAKHKRTLDNISPRWNAQDANGLPVSPSPFLSVTGGLLVNFQNLPVYPGTTPPTISPIVPNGQVPVPATRYPSNWGSGLDANFPRDLFRFNASQIQAFANQYVNWDPVRNKTWGGSYIVDEVNNAGYMMLEFDKEAMSGNVGLRVAQTKVTSTSYQNLNVAVGTQPPICPNLLQPCAAVPNAITSSVTGVFLPQVVETTHTALLPSVNLRYELAKGLIARGSVSRTLGRPNYNELAAAISLNNTLLTGSGGNPLLKPIVSTNIDASLAWYFGPRAYFQASLFTQDIENYVKAGTSQVALFNTSTNTTSIYTITSRIGVRAKLSGVEAALELPVGNGFGFNANATLVDGKDQDNVPLLGTSRVTYNLQGWFENESFGARLAWTRRSDYAIGFVGNGTNTPGNGVHNYKGNGSLSASLQYRITKNISLTLDGNNLLNPVRSTYYITDNAPGYWHESGRQFYLNLRAKY